jgi:hypothetical protein
MIRTPSSAAITDSSRESASWRMPLQWNVTSMSNREVLPAASQDIEAGLIADWLPAVARRLEDLAHRPERWDSYSANALRGDTADILLATLYRLGLFIQSEPVISLSDRGGLVAEWSSSQSELELLVNPDDDVMVYYLDRPTNREWEISASQAGMLEKWLWRASALL